MTKAGRCVGCGLVLAAAILGGCKKGDDERAAGPPVQVDTANDTPMDGVSDAQLKAQAQPLTPEQAAAQGLVDTTTHIEDLGPGDSVRAQPGTVGNSGADTAARAGASAGAPAAPSAKP